ncbi:hypothetical protein HZB03_05385 [Candidatus Woesearchaeota archaeon]|nr:hypothetical protein [Candidatus Woesearchaeota archaeon]
MNDRSGLWILAIIAVVGIVAMAFFGMRSGTAGTSAETAAGQALAARLRGDAGVGTASKDSTAVSGILFLKALAKQDLTTLKTLVDKEKGKALTAQEISIIMNRIDIVNAVEHGDMVISSDSPETLVALPDVIDNTFTIIQIDKEKRELTRFVIDSQRHLLIDRKKGDTVTNLGVGNIDSDATTLTIRTLATGLDVVSSGSAGIDTTVLEVTNIDAPTALTAQDSTLITKQDVTSTSISKMARS